MKINAKRTIHATNDRQAQQNLQRLGELKLTGVNILASPGAGKTSVIVGLLKVLPADWTKGVIEGDVASSIDTDYILSLGFPATQINTDGGCHLDAAMISRALDKLALHGPGLVFIENIGNLICPTSFALGESLRIVIASVPEGDDKPIKYPGVFATGDAIVLNKTDLLPYVKFDKARFQAGVRAVNPDAPLFELSCRTGEGMPQLAAWLADKGTRH